MNDTIELFPGVQFRKDTTKPLGNQWMFLHEDHWLIAKLAYCDDISMDHLAKVTRERDKLRAEVEQLRPCAARYRWMRDCPWPGHMQAVGIVAHGDDANWLAGADADRAIDAAMAPLSDEIPDFGGGGGNKARRRAASLGLDMDAAMKSASLADRQCHDDDCWLCEGTGLLDNGQLCDLNGKKVV